MNIHEYQAKDILRQFEVKVPRGKVILNSNEIENVIDSLSFDRYVVKAQIHAGGRGKGGGIKVATSKEEAKDIARNMLGSLLITPQTGPKGQKVSRVYIEEASDIESEYYLSLMLDRPRSCLVFIVSKSGGMNIEEVARTAPEKIIKVHVNPTLKCKKYISRIIAYRLGLSNNVEEVTKIIEGVYNAFVAKDASMVEINPLVTTKKGEIYALDAKINFDDNALYRQPDVMLLKDESEEDKLEAMANAASLNYVKLEGNIGCMVNGAGLAMATMDIIKLYGGAPANFLDVGGGADKKRVTEAFKIILSDTNVKGILVNIFGGIMKCDIIAEGIVEAAKETKINVPIVVRLEGTNVELGRKVLQNSGLAIIAADNLADAASLIVSKVR